MTCESTARNPSFSFGIFNRRLRRASRFDLTCSQVSHGTAELNVSNMGHIKYRHSPSVVVLNYFP